tara:strand:- start:361 stop:825 length:465 start_codon:yes stop_codon:yes gene_type:complete
LALPLFFFTDALVADCSLPPNVSRLAICPFYNHFEFSGWDLNKEVERLANDGDVDCMDLSAFAGTQEYLKGASSGAAEDVSSAWSFGAGAGMLGDGETAPGGNIFPDDGFDDDSGDVGYSMGPSAAEEYANYSSEVIAKGVWEVRRRVAVSRKT